MKKAGILMMVGSLLLLGLFVFPLWKILLGAPQYPEPLGMNIYIQGIEGASEFDLQNIDGLNHYIGMKKIPTADNMWEFRVFPVVIGSMAILGFVIGLLGFLGKINRYWFLGWLILMTVMGILGMYDFNQWLIEYGTDLDPNAIMKMTDKEGNPLSYKPPLLGHKKILNFDAYSFPLSGAYLMFTGMFLVLVSFFVGKKKA